TQPMAKLESTLGGSKRAYACTDGRRQSPGILIVDGGIAGARRCRRLHAGSEPARKNRAVRPGPRGHAARKSASLRHGNVFCRIWDWSDREERRGTARQDRG